MIEMKCPCCGSEKERPPYYAHEVTWSCSSCFFRCRNEDLPRVAAAMELAKAEVAASNAVWSVPLERLEPAVDAAEDMLFQAKMRVLEVFK